MGFYTCDSYCVLYADVVLSTTASTYFQLAPPMTVAPDVCFCFGICSDSISEYSGTDALRFWECHLHGIAQKIVQNIAHAFFLHEHKHTKPIFTYQIYPSRTYLEIV